MKMKLPFQSVQKKTWVVLFEMMIVCAIVVPVLGLSLYAVPVKDDFSTAVKVQRELADSGMLGAALRVTASRYITWGGSIQRYF